MNLCEIAYGFLGCFLKLFLSATSNVDFGTIGLECFRDDQTKSSTTYSNISMGV